MLHENEFTGRAIVLTKDLEGWIVQIGHVGAESKSLIALRRLRDLELLKTLLMNRQQELSI